MIYQGATDDHAIKATSDKTLIGLRKLNSSSATECVVNRFGNSSGLLNIFSFLTICGDLKVQFLVNVSFLMTKRCGSLYWSWGGAT